eukprot:gene11224-13750_t
MVKGYDEETQKFKIGVILSGDITDIGYNFMVNQARVDMEKLYENVFTKSKSYIMGPGPTIKACTEFVNEKYDLIIGSSFEHIDGIFECAKTYPNSKFLARGVEAAANYPNIGFIGFNPSVGHYLMGYYSALFSKKGVIGNVSPGLPSFSYATVNAYYLGAIAANPNTKVVSIETGSWFDRDLAIGATKKLFEEGCDVICQTQDDASVPETAIEAGGFGLGTSGFPIGTYLGQQIGGSIIYNLTNCFSLFTKMVLDNTWEQKVFYGDIGDTMSMGDYSSRINPSVIAKVEVEIERLLNVTKEKGRSAQPYYCQDLNKEMFPNDPQVQKTGCISEDQLFLSPLIYSTVKNLGSYTIEPKHVTYSSVLYGFSITVAVFGLITVLMLVGIYMFKDTKIIRSASPIFCMAILVGGLTVYAGIIVWVQDPNTALCRARVWLISLGYTIMISCMVVKNFRIWLIFDNPLLRKLKITNSKLFPYIAAIMCLNCVILAIYTGIGDIRSERSFGQDGLDRYSYLNTCKQNRSGNILLYILLIYHGISLLVGCFVSWKIRVVDIREFNESKPIANTLYAIGFCLFIIIPLMVSKQSLEGQNIIICASALFTTTSSLIILFLPKFWRLYTKGLDADPFSSSSTMSFAASVSKKVPSSSNYHTGHTAGNSGGNAGNSKSNVEVEMDSVSETSDDSDLPARLSPQQIQQIQQGTSAQPSAENLNTTEQNANGGNSDPNVVGDDESNQV